MPSSTQISALIDRHIAAWTAHDPEAVARTYAPEAVFVINRGEPMTSHAEIADMVRGFVDEFPDTVLTCHTRLITPDHAVYGWTFEGHHKDTGRHVKFDGWEEWDIAEDGTVQASLGWFDAESYQRQVDGG